MNKTVLVGRLVKDPEIRYTANNQTPNAKFTLAVNRMKKVENQPDADFVPIVVWGKSAENCGKYIAKGSLVAVAGRIQTRTWDDTEGKKHYATEVIADEVNFLDKKGETKGQAVQEGNGFTPTEEEDDLPF
jgi:single-strand DNA-binding protein